MTDNDNDNVVDIDSDLYEYLPLLAMQQGGRRY